MVGPLADVNDATTFTGKAALFGFAVFPAANCAALGEDALIRAAIWQFTRLFGPEAATSRATLAKD